MALIFISSRHLHKGGCKISTEISSLHTDIEEFVNAKVKNVKFDARDKTWSFTIPDAPLRVINIFLKRGFSIIPGGACLGGGDTGIRKYWWMMTKKDNYYQSEGIGYDHNFGAVGNDLPPSYSANAPLPHTKS